MITQRMIKTLKNLMKEEKEAFMLIMAQIFNVIGRVCTIVAFYCCSNVFEGLYKYGSIVVGLNSFITDNILLLYLWFLVRSWSAIMICDIIKDIVLQIWGGCQFIFNLIFKHKHKLSSVDYSYDVKKNIDSETTNLQSISNDPALETQNVSEYYILRFLFGFEDVFELAVFLAFSIMAYQIGNYGEIILELGDEVREKWFVKFLWIITEYRYIFIVIVSTFELSIFLLTFPCFTWILVRCDYQGCSWEEENKLRLPITEDELKI